VISRLVSLSETVVAGILDLTVGAPTEAAFVAALQAVLISGVPLWVISAIAPAFVLTAMNYVAQNIKIEYEMGAEGSDFEITSSE
jgi:hypothetical protein